jgi:hypothetical protein
MHSRRVELKSGRFTCHRPTKAAMNRRRVGELILIFNPEYSTGERVSITTECLRERMMTNDPKNAETPRQALAQKARQADMQAANDGARAATQVSVLINGGAATAILAFLSTYLSKTASAPPGILYAASASLFGYALGVCFGAWSMWCASQACGQFGLRWELFLDTEREKTDKEKADKEQTEKNYLKEGDRWLVKHKSSFRRSILSFVISSAVMAFGFLMSVK